jgi:uncharacterized protein YdaU (DUF1376 family)
LFTGDYLRDTRHLSPLKHGIYLLLLMHCWDQKGPVPLDEQEAAGIANCRSTDEIDALRYILERYFTRMIDGFYNHRMQQEVERSESISHARSEAGRKGYEARAKHLSGKSQAIAKQVHLSPSPSPSLSPAPSLERCVEPSGSTLSESTDSDADVAVDVGMKKAYRLPDCPYLALVDAYHAALPQCPRVEVLSDQRKRHIQARWRQVCVEEKLDSAAGQQWFADFFQHVGESKFLTGRTPANNGHKPFFANLDWLMSAEKFVHVYEGRYHR